jgi:hypothetical protein
MSRVRVTIDRVVLKGFEPAQGRAVADALQGELARVIAMQAAEGTAMQAQRTPLLRLGPMPLAEGNAGGRILGASVAASIGRGIKP